jgi:hypothetical protein
MATYNRDVENAGVGSSANTPLDRGYLNTAMRLWRMTEQD